MDVLLVTATVGGGVGRHVHLLAQGLLARGHRVAVACPGAVEDRFGFGALGAAVVPLELGQGVRPGDVRAVAALRALWPAVDVVHAHGVRAGAAAGLARRAGAPLVVTSHNAPPQGPARVVYLVLEGVVHRRADLVLGVSPDLVDRARRAGARRSDLAVVPADAGSPRSPEERAAARAALRAELGLTGTVGESPGGGPPADGARTEGAPSHGVPAHEPAVLLSVGRLAGQKRMDVLVRAYQQLLTDGTGGRPDPVLVLAGEGPEGPRLRALAAQGPGDIRFLGHRTDVLALLAGADVVVSAARWEGQPLGLQEALAAGAPIVATDVGGTGVVLGGAGLLVPGQEPAVVSGLAQAMGRVLTDDALRAQLSAAATRWAGELPDLDDAVAAALAAYARAGARHTGPGGAGTATRVT